MKKKLYNKLLKKDKLKINKIKLRKNGFKCRMKYYKETNQSFVEKLTIKENFDIIFI